MLGRLFAFSMIAYVATVVLVNIGFSVVPMIETPIGWLSPVALLVGAVFVLRDFAQRAAGHLVLVAMVLATVLSYILADPFIAIASAAAFASSELVDWLVYTVTKRPFRERVMLSSIISAPIDTGVFLFGISGFTWGTFVLMVLSKIVAALFVWFAYKPTDAGRIDDLEDQIELDFDKPFLPFEKPRM